MRLLVIVGLSAAIGAVSSWWATDSHYTNKMLGERIAQHEAYAAQLAAQSKRTEHYKSISEKYYADYENAINSEPTVVTERVFVRASCPASASTNNSGGLGDAGPTKEQRAELHQDVVRGATAVTDQADRDVLTCRAALRSLQEKIEAHNSSM